MGVLGNALSGKQDQGSILAMCSWAKEKEKVIAFKKFEIQGYCYHLSKFHIYVLVYCICVRDSKRDTDV